MPTVPRYDNLQTSVAGPAGATFQSPSGPNPGGIAAEQASQMGAAALRSGEAFSRMAAEMEDTANQVRVNDAVNQARIAAQDLAHNPESGFLQKKGASVFLDDAGKPLDTDLTRDYGGKLQTRISEITGTLANDKQRQAFGMQAGNLAAQFHGQVETHMTQQFNVYRDATDDATVKLAGQAAALNWSNPDAIFGSVGAGGQRQGGAVDQAKAAIYSKAKRAGLVGAPYDEAVLAGVSAIHTNVINAALQNDNPSYALSYMDGARKRGEMSGTDILKLQGHINQAVTVRLSQDAVQKASTAAMPAIAPTGFDRMVQIVAMTESGGRETDAAGRTITSPKGAQGIMQVMPATNKDPGFGVKPAQDDSPGERARVGRDYLQTMLQKYGDPAKAMAAYNAGPGALDKALKAGGDWLARMPRETQDYVGKNMAALQKDGAGAPRPTELDFVNTALGHLPAGAPPGTVKATRDAAVAQFGVITKTLDEKGANALAAGQRWAIANKDTPVSQLPPALRDDIARYAPGKLDDLNTFSKNLRKGEDSTNTALYLKLTSDSQYLASLSNDKFMNLRSELSEKDFDALNKDRIRLQKGEGATGWGNLNSQAINDTMSSRLRALKIDPTPKDGSAEAAAVGAYHKFVRDSIADAQRASGKQLTDVETAQHIDKLFATNVQFKSLFGGIFGGTPTKPLMSMSAGDIPSDVKAALGKDFAKRGNANPTDADYLGAYLRFASSKPRAPGATGNY
jgi:soluble lytic murein transglycosylase